MFAVFDGHGGSEVALYCSQKLPAFLKSVSAYQKADFEQALKDAFIGFDATLVNDDVIEELKKLIPDKIDGESETDEENEEDEENISELCQEGRMPLNELLEKLKDGKHPLVSKIKQGESSASKPVSPFLRGRRNGSSSSGVSSENGECSSQVDSSASRKLDINDDEDETVSSSSASGSVSSKPHEGTSANEARPSGPSKTINESNIDTSANGPTSSNASSSDINEKNCNSPDSSSTTNKSADKPKDAESSEATTNDDSVVKSSESKAEGVSSSNSSGEKSAESTKSATRTAVSKPLYCSIFQKK